MYVDLERNTHAGMCSVDEGCARINGLVLPDTVSPAYGDKAKEISRRAEPSRESALRMER